MLVLSRKKDESVFLQPRVGPEIEVKVMSIRGDKVRLGFGAPEHEVAIVRGELGRGDEPAAGDAALEAALQARTARLAAKL